MTLHWVPHTYSLGTKNKRFPFICGNVLIHHHLISVAFRHRLIPYSAYVCPHVSSIITLILLIFSETDKERKKIQTVCFIKQKMIITHEQHILGFSYFFNICSKLDSNGRRIHPTSFDKHRIQKYKTFFIILSLSLDDGNIMSMIFFTFNYYLQLHCNASLSLNLLFKLTCKKLSMGKGKRNKEIPFYCAKKLIFYSQEQHVVRFNSHL